jgi:peptidoglycan/xylan/chitin deacetylase (PgdA/CDA1 family)
MNWQRLSVFLLFFHILPLGAGIRFSGLDLSEDNRLLFKAESIGAGNENQNALLLTRLPNRDTRLLTVFPEKMELIEGGNSLLITNAFGSYQLPVTGGLPQAFEGFPAFGANAVPGSRAENALVSPDGKWLLYVEATSPAKGTLTLLGGTPGKPKAVSREMERPARFFPALWSPDSRGFLYAKGGKLYFYSVYVQSSMPEERHRVLGEGFINSVCWGKGGAFYYAKGSVVYRVQSADLFIRALYSSFLSMGQPEGKLPFEFDPNFDSFWIAPDGRSILFCKNGQNLFYYPLGLREEPQTNYAALPFIIASRAGARITVLWSPGGIATVLFGDIVRPPQVYRLNVNTVNAAFQTIQSPPEKQTSLSPDGRRVVFWGNTGLYLYDYHSWKLTAKLSSSPVFSCVWLSNNALVIGGEEKIERMTLSGTAGERKLLCLSSVALFGFEGGAGTAAPAPNAATVNGATINGAPTAVPAKAAAANGEPPPRRIAAFVGNVWYVTDGVSPWAPFNAAVRPAEIASPQFRVYLEQSRGFLENIPMVRNSAATGTFALFEHRSAAFEAMPSRFSKQARIPNTGDNYAFTNGSRGGREVALCFDLYDDATGLQIVLEALARFGIKSTFFVNGEFIRRHPQSLRDIASFGHESASMFHASIDLTDSRYRIDKDFIAKGLAHNEDEYYNATGKELALFWHPPYYALSRDIAAAAAASGYRTVGRDIDSRDWIRAPDARRLRMEQLSAADMINNIVDSAEGGSIIPVRLGLLEGGRPDYLFNNIEVLLDALIRAGYDIVPVSVLLNKSK